MKDNYQFLGNDFLLQNKVAENLYHNYAKDLPIIDYHIHSPPEEIAHNKTYSSITEVWLKGDHYKWRAMRANGMMKSTLQVMQMNKVEER